MNSSLKTRRFPRDKWRSIIAEKKKRFLWINFIQFLETEFFASWNNNFQLISSKTKQFQEKNLTQFNTNTKDT